MTSSAALLAAGLDSIPDIRAALLKRIDEAMALLDHQITAGRPLSQMEAVKVQATFRDVRPVVQFGQGGK